MNNAIFLAFDDKHASYARACLNSLRRNYPRHPDIHVFYDGSSSDVQTFLATIPHLHLVPAIDVPSLAGDVDLGVVNNAGIFYKYFAWTDYFSQYDNVLYLDVDTLVLQPLDELISSTDAQFIANHEPTSRIFRGVPSQNATLSRLLSEDGLPELDDMDDMCNAGVFVLTSTYRTPSQLNSLKRVTQRYDRFSRYADQSAISIWCRINEIAFPCSYQYNFQTPLFDSDLNGYDLQNIAIVHFSSKHKPDTIDFLRWGRVPKPIRKRLINLYFAYLYDKPVHELSCSDGRASEQPAL